MSSGDLLSQIGAAWSSLDPRQRRIAVASAAAVAVLAVLVVFAGRRTSLGVLYSDLTPDSASRVITALEAHHVSFQLGRGGTEILVPAERVAALRIQLAGEGLPEGTVGFGLFDHLPLGASEMVERVDFLRALEGELGRAVETLGPVAGARVMIALPQDSAFSSTQQPARASVVLRLRPGAQLSAQEVRAITHLVASSVTRLSPDLVSVVDDSGHLLAAGTGEGGDAAAGAQDLEQHVHDQIASLLDAVTGPGRSVVEVRAELRGSEIRTTTQRATAGTPVSQQQIRETYTGAGGVPAGVPGAKGQVPTYGIPIAGAGQGSYTRTEQTTNYQIGSQQTEVRDPAGSVQRIAVTVFADASAMTPATAANVEQAITTSFLDVKRGDSVVVARVPFWTAGAPGAAPRAPARGTAMVPVASAAAAGAVIAVLVVVLLARRRPRAQPARLSAASQAGPAQPAAPAPGAPGDQRAVAEWAKQNPATAADLVRRLVTQNGDRT